MVEDPSGWREPKAAREAQAQREREMAEREAISAGVDDISAKEDPDTNSQSVSLGNGYEEAGDVGQSI